MTIFQMTNICNGKIEGLVTSVTKIQITYICRDEMPILAYFKLF